MQHGEPVQAVVLILADRVTQQERRHRGQLPDAAVGALGALGLVAFVVMFVDFVILYVLLIILYLVC